MRSASYQFDGEAGEIHVTTWVGDDAPRFITVLAHGYGEHAGRYEHVADMLVGLGAVVHAPDHIGHGRSAGERALVEDIEALVTDLHAVADRARAEHPGLPLGTCRAFDGRPDRHPFRPALSRRAHRPRAVGTVGRRATRRVAMLLEMDPIPDIPIDPAILSRDPAVGAAYAADPLVYHGPFLKTTLQALDELDRHRGGGRNVRRRADAVDPRHRRPARALRHHGGDDGPDQGHVAAPHRLRRERPTRCSTRRTTTRCSARWPTSSARCSASTEEFRAEGWTPFRSTLTGDRCVGGGGAASDARPAASASRTRRVSSASRNEAVHVLAGELGDEKVVHGGTPLGYGVQCGARRTRMSPLSVWAWIETVSASSPGASVGSRADETDPGQGLDVEPGGGAVGDAEVDVARRRVDLDGSPAQRIDADVTGGGAHGHRATGVADPDVAGGRTNAQRRRRCGRR